MLQLVSECLGPQLKSLIYFILSLLLKIIKLYFKIILSRQLGIGTLIYLLHAASSIVSITIKSYYSYNQHIEPDHNVYPKNRWNLALIGLELLFMLLPYPYYLAMTLNIMSVYMLPIGLIFAIADCAIYYTWKLDHLKSGSLNNDLFGNNAEGESEISTFAKLTTAITSFIFIIPQLLINACYLILGLNFIEEMTHPSSSNTATYDTSHRTFSGFHTDHPLMIALLSLQVISFSWIYIRNNLKSIRYLWHAKNQQNIKYNILNNPRVALLFISKIIKSVTDIIIVSSIITEFFFDTSIYVKLIRNLLCIIYSCYLAFDLIYDLYKADKDEREMKNRQKEPKALEVALTGSPITQQYNMSY